MRFGAPIRIIAAAGVLALALVGLVVRENVARDQGVEVKLALAGHDPRSLLQGHYVRFQLQDTLPGGHCPQGTERMSFERTSWVALSRDGERHRPVGAAGSRVEAARLGEVTARGLLNCRREPGGPEEVTLDMNLGVDRIHLDQEEAEAVEAELRRARPDGGPAGFAVLSIGRDGKARVKGLIVGRRRVDLDWW